MAFLLSFLISLFSFGDVSTNNNSHTPIESPYAYDKSAQNGISSNKGDIIIVFEDTHFRPTIEK